MRILFFILFTLIFFIPACKQRAIPPNALRAGDISRVINAMTGLMVHDVTNPPLAARFFSYACLAGYEVVSENTRLANMHGRLNGYPVIHKPDSVKGSDYQFAAILAMLETAKNMQPSGKLLETFEDRFIDSCRHLGYAEETIFLSKKYALAVSKIILAYARADGYNKISGLPRYTPLQKDGYWYPTPPAYIAAVEPYFKNVRPFTLDSSSQFKPPPPVTYSSQKNSPFYKQLLLMNYQETPASTDLHGIIAGFWDCNPFAVQDEGHMQVGLKKISPGAHWMGITDIACLKTKTSFEDAMKINTVVAIGLMDSFIACWDEKYRSNRIRPETAVRKLLDINWKPLLQTPPFPEYLSGHSCISATSAAILTRYFGDRFHYTDTVEVSYGLAPRSFESFQQAAVEAGISRFYGGIHFMDAITNGRQQGLQVGDWVIRKVKI